MHPAIALLAIVVACIPLVVNPAKQPADIIRLHRATLVGTITSTDEATRTLAMRVDRVVDGAFAPATVTIAVATSPEEGHKGDLMAKAGVGDVVVAFIGKKRGEQGDGLLYHGMQWHEVSSDPADAARWTRTRSCGDKLKGTYVGLATHLARLLDDAKVGRAFFPAVPFCRFREVRELGTGTAPWRGVALVDVDGDGLADALGTSESGCRLYRQQERLVFVEATATWGLEGVAARSVSAADADADGRTDLLLDGMLYLNQGGRFVASAHLPGDAQREVLAAAFVELDGDGRPDVVVARRGGGLRAWMNGGAGRGFIDASARLGLERAEAGAGETGWFAPGDWNGDGRTDLFLSVRNGILLVQGGDGSFAPVAHRLALDFAAAPGGEAAGAGCFAPLTSPDGADIVVACDARLGIIGNRDGVPQDITRFGNETNVTRTGQLATLAEDLNLDGNPDLITFTRAGDKRNIFHTNRGYGSYMADELYTKGDILPGAAYGVGQWGAAVGDVDRDGTPDLLLGGVDGTLRLVLNDALSGREASESDTWQQRVLARTAVAAVDLAPGPGVVGARITITTADGRVLAWRRIGDAVLTGCSGLPQARIAVREPGEVLVTVRWADGVTATRRLDLPASVVTPVAIARPAH